jgi:ribulose-phosphate 3-epimerase
MQEIVPSLLSADFSKLQEEIQAVERAGATKLHLDIMDGHFVPNITFGPIIIKAIRKLTKLHLETHLMIENADKYLDNFIEAGSDTVIIHVESSKNIITDLQYIRSKDVKAGLVINPPTDFSVLEPYFEDIDHLLIMTVNPGFGGQSMIEEALEKVTRAQRYQKDNNFLIEIDGGVNLQTIAKAAQTGVDLLVAGSAVFGRDDPKKAFQKLTEKL